MSKLPTTRSDTGVFDSMGIFEMADSTRSSLSVRLQFAKFAHGFTISDFEGFIESIGQDNVVSLGRLSFPNEWQMTLSSQKTREELIRLGRARINNRSCWIHPLSSSEIRGFVHWLPNEVPDSHIKDILRNFGEVLFMEIQDYTKFNYKIASDARYFALYLKPGASKEDLPHFITLARRRALITVRGRQPACFHCREVGHRKNECKVYRERLGEYCLRPPGTSGRRGKRGKRHKPDVSNCSQEKGNSEISRCADEVQNLLQNLNEAEMESTTKQETTKNKNKKKSRRKKKNVKKEIPSTLAEAPTVEVIGNSQCRENEDFVEDSSETNAEMEKSFPNSFIEERHNLNSNVDDTKVLSVLLNEDASLNAEKVDFVPGQEKSLVESTIQNPCDKFDQLNDYVIEKHCSLLIQNQSPKCVDEKSLSVSNSEMIAKNSSESVPLQSCLDTDFKNVCNDLAKMVHDSSTDSVCNNSQQVSERIQESINNQISEILNSFILQVTNVLSEAGVVNVNEIKTKLLGINGTSLCSKSESEPNSNLLEHDKNSNVIEPSNVSKVSKKKKKKSKKLSD